MTYLWTPLIRRASLIAAAALLAAGVASAQSTPSPNLSDQVQSSSPGYSSSQAGLPQFAELALPDAPAPKAAASAGGSGGGQYGNGGGGGSTGTNKGLLHNLAFEIGGGFNAPQSSSVTYGGQFTLGGGVRINRYLSALVEYQFLDAKLPGGLIAEAEAQGGHAHIWSFTLDPVVDVFPKKSNDVYVTGGGGFYRKVSSFTDPEEEEECYYFCEDYETNVTVAHFSSNSGGYNIGGGFQHRMGSMYGESHSTLFLEARYVDVLSPAITGLSPNGSGYITTVAADTKVIPISVGVRF